MLLRAWVWSSAGVVHHGVARPEDTVPVLTLACPAGSLMAGLHVVCLESGCWFYSSMVGVWRRQPPHGRLACRWACRAAAGVGTVVFGGLWCR